MPIRCLRYPAKPENKRTIVMITQRMKIKHTIDNNTSDIP